MKKYILMMIIALGVYAEDSLTVGDSFFTEDKNTVAEESSFDSSALFDESDNNTTIEDITADLLKKSVSLTGDFKMGADYSNYDKIPDEGDLSSSLSSNLNLDVRLTEGVKAYTSLNLEKANVDMSDNFMKLNEMFFDFNIKDKVYTRVGKQNLAWGRGYFFNPTDLINLEKKELNNVSGQREGNYGVKVHVPFGVTSNFYTYVQMEDKTRASDLTLAIKYEFLIKNAEYSVATIIRDNKSPVVAMDFGGSWGKAQTFGELLLQNGDDVNYYENGTNVKMTDKLVAQGTLGYSRTFDRGATEDKKTLMLIQEVYYNGAGYTKDGKDGFPPYVNFASPTYNPYSDGQYYLANFITLNKFMTKDLSLGINSLSNLSDNVHMLAGNFSYKLNEEVNLGTSLTTYLGEQGVNASKIPNYTLGLSANISF